MIDEIIEAIAKPGRDGARPSHKCANAVRNRRLGRDGLCPVRNREGFATASIEYLRTATGIEVAVSDVRGKLRLTPMVASLYDFVRCRAESSDFALLIERSDAIVKPTPAAIESHVGLVSGYSAYERKDGKNCIFHFAVGVHSYDSSDSTQLYPARNFGRQ